MSGSSRLTPAQLADALARRRDGRPDLAAMSNAERRRAGLMTRREAAEHERLATVPHWRLADRSRGPDPDDIWAGPDPDDAAAVAAWARIFAAGHGDHGGWTADSRDGHPVCACGEVILPEGATP